MEASERQAAVEGAPRVVPYAGSRAAQKSSERYGSSLMSGSCTQHQTSWVHVVLRWYVVQLLRCRSVSAEIHHPQTPEQGPAACCAGCHSGRLARGATQLRASLQERPAAAVTCSTAVPRGVSYSSGHGEMTCGAHLRGAGRADNRLLSSNMHEQMSGDLGMHISLPILMGPQRGEGPCGCVVVGGNALVPWCPSMVSPNGCASIQGFL